MKTTTSANFTIEVVNDLLCARIIQQIQNFEGTKPISEMKIYFDGRKLSCAMSGDDTN